MHRVINNYLVLELTLQCTVIYSFKHPTNDNSKQSSPSNNWAYLSCEEASTVFFYWSSRKPEFLNTVVSKEADCLDYVHHHYGAAINVY